MAQFDDEIEDPELDALKKEQDANYNQKLGLNLVGGIGDTLASRQGFGNFFLGKMAPQSNAVSGLTSKIAGAIEDPADRQKKAFEYLKSKNEMGADKTNRDPMSNMSKAKKAMAQKYGLEVTPEMSGYEVDQLMDSKKMNETEAMSRVNFDNDMEKLKFSKNADLQKMREQEALEARRKKEELEAKKGEGMTEGRKAADKDYAKDYNDFTGGGANKAADAIQKLKDMKDEMAKDNGLVQAGGGPISGSMPDWARTQTSIARRDNIVSVANSALKATFGGQLSDGERKALANEFYNDKLSNAENLKIIERKVKELEGGLAVSKSKADFFAKKGTLTGFEGPGAEQKTEMVKVRAPNGKIVNVPKTDLKQALAGGGTLVDAGSVAGGQ